MQHRRLEFNGDKVMPLVDVHAAMLGGLGGRRASDVASTRGLAPKRQTNLFSSPSSPSPAQLASRLFELDVKPKRFI
jgi:hypothetical protein